jgi:ribosomal-protein-alanine N-acetyltransferase
MIRFLKRGDERNDGTSEARGLDTSPGFAISSVARTRDDRPLTEEAPMIRTPRLVIRRFTPGDLADFLAYQGDPLVRRHMQGSPMTTAEAIRYLAGQAALADVTLDTWHGFAIQHVEQDRMIGDLGVYLDGKRAGTGDVGFQFRPDQHRLGYGYEAMVGFFPYLFLHLGLDAVTASCDRANVASYGLMERLGMTRAVDGPTLHNRQSRADRAR